MSRVRVVICRVEDEGAGEQTTEVARFDLPETDLSVMEAGTGLDVLEEVTHQHGQAVLRGVLQAQRAATDAAAVAAHRRLFPPEAWARGGLASLEVASRFGRLTLQRQMLATGVGTAHEAHATPGDAALPPHGGLVITRGLQEMACLLPDTLPFVTAERLLGWQTQAAPETVAAETVAVPEAKRVLCASTLRTAVREHGAALAEAEWREVTRVRVALTRGEGATEGLCPRLVPALAPRRRAGWPAALSAAVDQALAAGETRPPRGVRVADWERVLATRRQERADAGTEDLRRLGPEVGPAEVVASADDVLTRRPQRRQFWELRTARVATAEGYRYVSGTGATFLATLAVLCALCQGTPAGSASRRVVFLVDGGRWLRDFFAATLAPSGATLILDWYHLHHRCYQVATQVCRDKPTRVRFLGTMGRLLWRGDVDGAIAAAEDFRPAAKAVQRQLEWLWHTFRAPPLLPDLLLSTSVPLNSRVARAVGASRTSLGRTFLSSAA